MKYPVTPSKRTSVSVADLTEEKVSSDRGRTRRRLSLEFLLGGNNSSTPVRSGPTQKRVRRSVSASRRFSLGCSLADLETATAQDYSLPVSGRSNTPHTRRCRSRSTTSDADLDVTPVSFMTTSSFADVSNISIVNGSYVRSSSVIGVHGACSTSNLKCVPAIQNRSRSSQKTRPHSRNIIGSMKAAAGTLVGRRSGSMAIIPNTTYDSDAYETGHSSLSKTPTKYSLLQQEEDDDSFLPAEQHPDFQDTSQDVNLKKGKRRKSSFSARGLLGIGRKSAVEIRPNFQEPNPYSITSQRNVKKRRASDINIREILGETARRFSRREKEPRIAEDVYDMHDLPDLKKLPMTKKALRSPTTGISTSPSRCLDELLKRKACILRFRAFLQSEFSEENLDFWIECESYRYQRIHKQRKLAPKIYNKYVAIRAPREVNLDAMTRRKTKAGIECPDSTTFELAQTKIFKLMERDSFKRFRQSLNKTSAVSKSNVPKTIVTPLSFTENGQRKVSV
ncbi:uncharacterized protein LOC120345070 [Styela clava]|uniref:uncharacterized protein LOC120345070 n=1 Tax=Styela clava TaxID=7725 RepID=UPI00193AD156|nr:uncharacterized protein LOC120345070 [Styela clava]